MCQANNFVLVRPQAYYTTCPVQQIRTYYAERLLSKCKLVYTSSQYTRRCHMTKVRCTITDAVNFFNAGEMKIYCHTSNSQKSYEIQFTLLFFKIIFLSHRWGLMNAFFLKSRSAFDHFPPPSRPPSLACCFCSSSIFLTVSFTSWSLSRSHLQLALSNHPQWCAVLLAVLCTSWSFQCSPTLFDSTKDLLHRSFILIGSQIAGPESQSSSLLHSSHGLFLHVIIFTSAPFEHSYLQSVKFLDYACGFLHCSFISASLLLS